jgi:hypothetical protein
VPAPLNNGPEWKVLIKLAQFDWRFKFGNMPSKVQSVVGAMIPRHILRVRERFELESDWITNAEPTQLPKETLNRVP